MRAFLPKAQLFCFIAALILRAATVQPATAEQRGHGRSMIITPCGIVAASYVQASQAGARILERGGSAIDAGIAANAVLSVAEPSMNGIDADLYPQDL